MEASYSIHKIYDFRIQKAADYGIAMTFLVAFTFIPCGLAIYIVNEHRNKEKQLQFLSGVGPVMYWVTSLVWDMVRRIIITRHLYSAYLITQLPYALNM
jgi:membrane protein insertase Oxa1/YidC/SpoIIIJ